MLDNDLGARFNVIGKVLKNDNVHPENDQGLATSQASGCKRPPPKQQRHQTCKLPKNPSKARNPVDNALTNACEKSFAVRHETTTETLETRHVQPT